MIGEAVAIGDWAVAPGEVLGEAIGGTQGVDRGAIVASGGLEQKCGAADVTSGRGRGSSSRWDYW